jgi:PAS domain S-box-containing protein
VQHHQSNQYQCLPDESSDFLEPGSLKTSDQDRLASFCNTLRGYEEFILNMEGIIISSNLEAVNITGYEEWEVIGKHFSIFYPREDVMVRRPDEDLKAALDAGKIFYSGSCIKKKGISFWAKIRISTFKSDEEDVNGYRLVLKDSTHSALYNYRVKRVRDEYMNLFNNSFIGIFKFRLKDCKILLLNEKAQEMLGVKSYENLYFSDLFSDEEALAAFKDRLHREDVLDNCETQIEHKGLWLSINCRGFVNQGFAEGILVDITEKKKQIAELERLNQEIDKFIYHSSHDMRAPLTTIMGLTHLVDFEAVSEPVRQYNQMIQTQVTHLDNLLKSLVNLTFNKSDKQHEVIDFDRELDVILREYRHSYREVTAQTTVEGNAPFVSDPARIHIILKNLVSNAFRFHNPQAEKPFVKINISVGPALTRVCVEDNGIGIDHQALDSIFTMFYKAERGSTGLGLYIVKSMIDKLGGTISVESKRWHGSRFVVTIPASTAVSNM